MLALPPHSTKAVSLFEQGVDMAITQSLARRRTLRRFLASRKVRRTAAFYTFIGPWLIGLVCLSLFPMIVGFLTSFTNYDGLNIGNLKFVGLSNYQRAFALDPDARFAFTRTLAWAVLNLPLWMILSFILALILNQEVKGRGVFRTLYYLPSVVPSVALVWIWKIFLDMNYGLLNGLISVFRPGTAIPWLSTYALHGLTVIAVWGGLGAGMVIFLAGLQGIPDELVEAAQIDGANKLQVFWNITIPLLTPVIFFQLINGLIGSFQQLVLPQLLTTGSISGGRPVPPRSVYLYMIHVDRQIFGLQRFGYASALLWMLFVVIASLTYLVFKTEKYWVYSEVETGGESP
jgi:multiple sugar transport system permease protein